MKPKIQAEQVTHANSRMLVGILVGSFWGLIAAIAGLPPFAIAAVMLTTFIAVNRIMAIVQRGHPE